MSFVRVADGLRVELCLVGEGGVLRPLRLDEQDTVDYVSLYEHARARGKTISAYAAEIGSRSEPLPWRLAELDVAPDSGQPHLVMPYVPPEVWGAAFTYNLHPGRAASDDAYAKERTTPRPVVFFKATPHRCVGPNDSLGSRADARLMIPEPELGLILDASGGIIGYTAVNDMSSRDLPKENPLWVSYSKIFARCVSLGPAIVSPECLPDPRSVAIGCRVVRDGKTLWDDTGNTSRMIRSFDELIRYLTACNPIPSGTLLATGTALAPPGDMHLVEGDWVEVCVSGIGRLRNSVTTIRCAV